MNLKNLTKRLLSQIVFGKQYINKVSAVYQTNQSQIRTLKSSLRNRRPDLCDKHRDRY